MTFAGLLVIAVVLWFWLRRISRAHFALLAVVEATINRALSRHGEPPIISKSEADEMFR